jgi:peptidyl-prolyl cis-trans isomerase A (cyclophilin A)
MKLLQQSVEQAASPCNNGEPRLLPSREGAGIFAQKWRMNMNWFQWIGVVALLFSCTALQAQDKNPVVVMETSEGKIKIELDQKNAPITVKNFLMYVESKHYDGTIFHRVIDGFMIQGGGFTKEFKEKDTKDPIKNEASNGLSNKRGTIAMARTNDPNSATAQFFINVVDNKGLDPKAGSAGYAVFGKVTEGMDVVDRIRKVQTGVKQVNIQGMSVPFEDVPAKTVEIKSVRVEK